MTAFIITVLFIAVCLVSAHVVQTRRKPKPAEPAQPKPARYVDELRRVYEDNAHKKRERELEAIKLLNAEVGRARAEARKAASDGRRETWYTIPVSVWGVHAEDVAEALRRDGLHARARLSTVYMDW